MPTAYDNIAITVSIATTEEPSCEAHFIFLKLRLNRRKQYIQIGATCSIFFY
jgi:hypothetical protein